jgi:hypothetical protein
MKRTW